jgi:hypothetical protein
MGLCWSHAAIEGPAAFDDVLAMPELPAAAPRLADGSPAFLREVAVLAVPADKRQPGHDFVFRLDPPGLHALDHALLGNTPSDNPKRHGDKQLFAKDFSIAVSSTEPTQEAFREILRGSLAPHTEPQRFDLPKTEARYVRLRIHNGHNSQFDRVTLGEFQLFDAAGVNLVGSHVADRTRDGADLLRQPSSLGFDKTWTAEHIHDGKWSGPGASWSSDGLPPPAVDDPAAIVDLTDKLDASGRLHWNAPPGRWVVYRFVCANTGERLKVPSPKSDGLATDHFSREATQTFLNTLIDRLRAQTGDLGKTALRQLYLASYEVRGRIWTPRMLDEFQRYRGYDMRPFLLVLAGGTVGDEEVTARFIYDYRKTLGDLLVDAYYRAAVETAHAAGLGVESEAGGPGPPIHQVPVDALKALGVLDEVRGEFWPRRPDADRLWVVKETACAAHIYGKPRVRMEAFTSTHHWQDGPFDLKPSADRAMCEGTNQFVWHTSSHQPPAAGRPGWVYGAGTHLGPNLVWWPKAKPFLDYLARCSFLLQQGRFVGDVCYYYGDQGYNFVPPKHVDPSLGFGYDYDVVNQEVLLSRMKVLDGRLVLPDGLSYAVLVLPDRPDIDLDVLRRLEQLVRDGATIIGPKPIRATGLADHERRDAEVRTIAERLWGSCDGRTVFENAVGRGRVVQGSMLREVLKSKGVGPDLWPLDAARQSDIDFIHRRTDDADIYFVRNKKAESLTLDVAFRVKGRAPEIWDATSGQVAPHYDYRTTDEGVVLPIEFAPYDATFVVFRKRGASEVPLAITSAVAAGAPSSAARIDRGDGHRLTLAVHQNGHYRIDAADGRKFDAKVESLPPARTLEGGWKLTFAEGQGAPPSIELDRLISWTEHELPSVRHFSGIAAYTRTLELPDDWTPASHGVLLDLGDLWSVGEVYVNDVSTGIVWKPPYRVDITGALRPGKNRLKIEIANTWSNRLVGDATLPAGERTTRTNIARNNGVLWKDVPLLRSGLFGPVRLIPERRIEVE